MKFEKPELTIIELVSENVTVNIGSGDSTEVEEV